MSALSRCGCGVLATRPQLKWCAFSFGLPTIHDSTPTLLNLQSAPPGLTTSDPTYFAKAVTLSYGVAILQKGIYHLSLHVAEISNAGRGTPRMLWPHFLNPVAPINRSNNDSTSDGTLNVDGLSEMAYDNTFEGYTNFPNPTPGSGYGTYAELRTGYSLWFRVGDGLALQNSTEVNFYYQQRSGADRIISANSQGGIMFFPSDVENHPQGYGTTYSYP